MISFADKKSLARDVLGPEGLLARSHKNFEFRPQQLEMAAAVTSALKNRRVLTAEAGTGVGKSYAYSVPAVEFALENSAKIIISTYTINLQQQLINKDIPFLAGFVPDGFTAALAKGKQNYLCKRRLAFALKKKQQLFSDEQPDIIELDAWSRTTNDGSLSDLPFPPSPKAWDAVKAEHGNCPGRKCPHFKDCFYRRARRTLDSANIIVANHALLTSDLVLKQTAPGILPEYKAAIIDEAHNLQHVAEQQLGISVSNLSITYMLNNIYNTRTRKGLISGTTENKQARDIVKSVEQASKIFFAQVAAWLDNVDPENSSCRCDRQFVDDNITHSIRALRLELTRLIKKTDDEDHQYELDRYVDKCRALELEIKDFIEQPTDDNIYWIESAKTRSRRIALKSAPVDVGPGLKQILFDPLDSVILTSATLSCESDTQDPAGGFEFFAQSIGIEDYDAVRLGSPFDYQNQATIYIEADLPEPTQNGFIEPAADAVIKYIKKTSGSAFVLFTSYSMLRKFEEIVRPFTDRSGIELLVQGSGIDRGEMLEKFKADHSSVLFGTDSFWQGVDVPGCALKNVIIVRLPFAVPNHPLVQGRIETIKQQGKNPFTEYQLPTAILKFKQGFGRLIRNQTDSGIIVILDSRIIKRHYGKLFLKALPQCPVEVVSDNYIE